MAAHANSKSSKKSGANPYVRYQIHHIDQSTFRTMFGAGILKQYRGNDIPLEPSGGWNHIYIT